MAVVMEQAGTSVPFLLAQVLYQGLFQFGAVMEHVVIAVVLLVLSYAAMSPDN